MTPTTLAASGIAPFVYTAHPARVVFGPDKLKSLPDELAQLGGKRALLLCTPQQTDLAEHAAQLLGAQAAGIFDGAAMHVPIEAARQARDTARQLGADVIVALGGGSTTGLGKAIALESPIPIIAVPTTYAGSEMTPIYGITEDGIKKTGKDLRVLPRTVIYDPLLTLGLPVPLSVTSGMNAIAHAAEGLYSKDGNPVINYFAMQGISDLAQALPGIRANPQDINARSLAQRGAWFCGMVLGLAGMALHHKLCHTLGGSFNLPHAETHTVVLPYAMAFNRSHAAPAMSMLAQALGQPNGDGPALLHALAKDNGAPTSLRELGMTPEQLQQAADIAMQNPYWNPRPLEHAAILHLLQDAYEGKAPHGG
jgi:alcohol dehydrogenase class IV